MKMVYNRNRARRKKDSSSKNRSLPAEYLARVWLRRLASE